MLNRHKMEMPQRLPRRMEALAKEAKSKLEFMAKSKYFLTFSELYFSDVTSANTHLAAGKRALLIGDANGAVTTLATACEKFGKLYGETAKECGEAYFYYGKALLEMARMEAGVIDNVLDGGTINFLHFL